MIRVGNALAPRWYESNPAKLEHLLDRIQASGATTAEFVLLPGEATAAQRRVQVPEAQWRATADAVLRRGMTCSFHAPLDPEFSLRGWHNDRPRLEMLYARLLQFADDVGARQGAPVPFIVHASRSQKRNELANADDTATFLKWALRVTRENGVVDLAVELRDQIDLQETWFDADRFSLLRFVRSLESERVGICWDLGHDWQNAMRRQEGLQPPTQLFFDHVLHVHAHDGIADLSVHHPLGSGILPVNEWIRALCDSGYDRSLILEIRYRYAREAGDPWDVLDDSYRQVLKEITERTDRSE